MSWAKSVQRCPQASEKIVFFHRSETLMSGVMTMSFDAKELGERSISTHDVIVSDVSVIQFDVRYQ